MDAPAVAAAASQIVMVVPLDNPLVIAWILGISASQIKTLVDVAVMKRAWRGAAWGRRRVVR